MLVAAGAHVIRYTHTRAYKHCLKNAGGAATVAASIVFPQALKKTISHFDRSKDGA